MEPCLFLRKSLVFMYMIAAGTIYEPFKMAKIGCSTRAACSNTVLCENPM